MRQSSLGGTELRLSSVGAGKGKVPPRSFSRRSCCRLVGVGAGGPGPICARAPQPVSHWKLTTIQAAKLSGLIVEALVSGGGLNVSPVRPVCCCDSIVAARERSVCSSATETKAAGATATSNDAAQVAVLPAPMAPWKGAPLRVIFAAEKPINGELALIAPDGSVAAKSSDRQGGPPYFWLAEVAAPAAGTWHATLTRADGSGACSTITRDIPGGQSRAAEAARRFRKRLAGARRIWNRATENLYSAWIRKLF